MSENMTKEYTTVQKIISKKKISPTIINPESKFVV